MMDIIGKYIANDNELIVIMQYPNGKYYIHYGYMPEKEIGNCVAGGFETVEEAEKMLMKHRPNVKGIETENVIRAARKVVEYFKYHNKNTTKSQDAILDELEEALQLLK